MSLSHRLPDRLLFPFVSSFLTFLFPRLLSLFSLPNKIEYLSNSECFKKVSVDNCGNFYLQLIDHVSNPRSHDDHICWYDLLLPINRIHIF